MPNEPLKGVWSDEKPYATVDDLTPEERERLGILPDIPDATGEELETVVVLEETTEYRFEIPSGEAEFVVDHGTPLDQALENVRVIKTEEGQELDEIVIGVRPLTKARQWEVDILDSAMADAREGERRILSALDALSVLHDSRNQDAAYKARMLVEEIESVKAVRDRRWEKEGS